MGWIADKWERGRWVGSGENKEMDRTRRCGWCGETVEVGKMERLY